MPEVELFELGPSVLDELANVLTPVRMAHVGRQLRRLQEYGRSLGPSYFEKVKGSKRGLGAFRISADKVEIRILYRQEGDLFVMLLGFPKKGMDIPPHLIAAAEKRWDRWKESNP